MNIKEIKIPAELIGEISHLLGENEIINEIKGITEDYEIRVELQYEKHERPVIHKILDLIEDFSTDGVAEDEEE